MKNRWKVVLIIVIVVVALAALYFTFGFTKTCKDEGCFNSAMAKCSRASYLDDRADAVWQYQIIGSNAGNCRIEVTLLQLKNGTLDMASMENKKMECDIALNVVMAPQSNLDNCHGLLKEEMQKIMINKLFAYITSNVGQISEELTKVI